MREVAVVGQMRGGTTVLRQFIGSAPSTVDIGEVFHAKTDLQTNFWGFLHTEAAKDPAYRHPFIWPRAWKEFIERHRKQTGANTIVFDTKFEYFQYTLRADSLQSHFFFETNRTAFVLILRKNTLAQVVSRIRAERTGIWSAVNPTANTRLVERFKSNNTVIERPAATNADASKGAVTAPRKADEPTPKKEVEITVDPNVVFAMAEQVSQRNEAMRRLLKGRNAIDLWYEDLFNDNGSFRDETADKVAALCGISADQFDRHPVLKRQNTGRILADIANADALRARFAHTNFGWMLED